MTGNNFVRDFKIRLLAYKANYKNNIYLLILTALKIRCCVSNSSFLYRPFSFGFFLVRFYLSNLCWFLLPRLDLAIIAYSNALNQGFLYHYKNSFKLDHGGALCF